jgi:SAM-dependent methyltransferase
VTTTIRTWAEPVAGPGGDPQLGCDLPIDLGPILAHNELLIGGWAVAGAGRIAAVEIEVGGRTTLASYGHPSPFLAGAFQNAEHARFEFRLDTGSLERGRHQLLVRARTSEGALAEMTGEIEVEPYRTVPWRAEDQRAAVRADEPAMWCETPNIFEEGRVHLPATLRGWAHAGSGIASVAAFVDGVRIEGVARLPRADLRDRIGPAVVAAGGFRVRLTAQDLSPGRYDLTVIAYPVEEEPIGVTGTLTVLSTGAAWSPRDLSVDDDDLTRERYVPSRHTGTSIEIEHHARYRWAATLVERKDVLDAGCGTGWGTNLLAKAGAASVTGVDLDEAAVKHGGAEFEGAIELRVGDLCSLDLPDASFDVVVCFEAIEHLDDPSSALDHFRRVLRPDGLLLISTPVRGVYPPGNPFHVHEYEPGELEAALSRRFDHVRAHRQRTHYATLLADDAITSQFNADRSLELDVRKLDGVPPGQELYTVAVASDAVLPPAPRIAVLGDGLDHRALQDALRDAQSQIDEAEGRATFADMHVQLLREMHQGTAERLDAAERELAIVREAQTLAQARLDGVVYSKSWRWTAPLRALARRARDETRQRKKP